MTPGFDGPFGRSLPKKPTQPDRSMRCRKRRPCEGSCGFPIKVGDRLWLLNATGSRLCADCYEIKRGEGRQP